MDFVITHEHRSVAVEVKAASRFGRSDLAGLRAFLARSDEETTGILAYNGEEVVPVGDRMVAVPMGLLLS